MERFLQVVIDGIADGSVYAALALALVLIFRSTGVVNFAQGGIGTFAAYIAFVDLVGERGWATLPALVVAVIAAGAVSLAFQATVLRALRGESMAELDPIEIDEDAPDGFELPPEWGAPEPRPPEQPDLPRPPERPDLPLPPDDPGPEPTPGGGSVRPGGSPSESPGVDSPLKD